MRLLETEVVAGLPEDFGAAEVLLQHADQRFRSHLPEILERRSTIPVERGRRRRLRPGRIAVAPPGAHLVLRAHNRRRREIECQVFLTPLERNDHGRVCS
ncbi:MAG: two-component system, chemotaxis family, protein-glutamate methylesterase/glutaminase [Miltoncostaeaceae bacterium]|nr:two-component system, chemotaxis family, protein-glutamate methylesterase/glutaminase [Miltoncostaeaceae bacterium]